MKHYILLAIALLTFSVPIIAQPVSPDILYKNIQTNVNEKKFTEAVAQAEQALNNPDLSPADKVRFLNAAADTSMRQSISGYPAAETFYVKIVADPTIDNTDKINALNNLANAYISTLAGQYLDKMDLSPASDALNRALQLPNLKPEERATALVNIGRFAEREAKYDQACATYQQILNLDVSERTKSDAWRSIANADASEGRSDEAVAIYNQHGFDLIPLYKQLGETDKVVELVTVILDNPKSTDQERWAAFIQLPYWGRVSTNYLDVIRKYQAGIRQISEKYLPGLMKTDTNHALILLSEFKNTPVSASEPTAASLANPGFISWAAPFLLQAPKLSDKDYALVKTKYINALAEQGNVEQAVQETRTIAADPRMDAAAHFWSQLVAAILASQNTVDISQIVQQGATLPDQAKAQAILDAAQTVLRAGDNLAAHNLYAAYEGLFAHSAQASIDCKFVQQAPFDVGSWVTSPLLKDADSAAQLNRPYGDNLQFLLETDSASAGRNVQTSSNAANGDADTNFHIACDAQGIHFFFNAHDSHTQEVLDSLLSGGSFEMYLAPGEHQAYYTFLPNLPDGKIDTGPSSFITMYPNAGWRLPSTEDGTLITNTHRTKDGFGFSLFLSWDMFYDKLPANGDKWQFEAIRWTRSGGFSFGGSQSVHNRSSWGNIVFSGMTKENLDAIKRGIVFTALAKYNAATKITGTAGKWADPELGDPLFYQTDVKPLLQRLDGYAAKVNKEMTDADVETVFNEAVPDWMELNYRIAALREGYLQKKMLGGN